MENLYSVASVMVIDDEAFSRSYVSRLLEGLGIGEIVTADDGAQALEKLEARESGLDLIICDVEMPEMTGYEFIRRVRYGIVPRFKDIPIIVLTGQDSDKNVRQARVLKIDGFVVKPPDKDVFERKIRRIVAGKMRDALAEEAEVTLKPRDRSEDA